ncbi:hypothetical protein GLYMA_13G152474v4 [Glycine max]|nr:hypothetical protein GLYMA_13G152474v4 [Glycine max]
MFSCQHLLALLSTLACFRRNLTSCCTRIKISIK